MLKLVKVTVTAVEIDTALDAIHMIAEALACIPHVEYGDLVPESLENVDEEKRLRTLQATFCPRGAAAWVDFNENFVPGGSLDKDL
jgi:hypothetical protein